MISSPSQATKLRNQQFVSQIFWPSHCTHLQQRSFIIGWNLDNFRCCVVCAVPSEFFSLSELEELLRNLQADDAFRHAIAPCSKNNVPPVVLGEFFPDIEKDYIPPLIYQNATIWLSMAKDSSGSIVAASGGSGSGGSSGSAGGGSGVRLHSIYSSGCLYKTSCYLIQYDQMDTDKLHHFSFPQDAQSDLAYTVHQTCASREIERLIKLHSAFGTAARSKKKPRPEQTSRNQRSVGLAAKFFMALTYAWLSANLWARDACDSPLRLFGSKRVPARSGSIALAHLRQRCCEIASWTVSWKEAETIDSIDMSKRVRHWVDVYASIANVLVDIMLGLGVGLLLWMWADEVSDQMRWLWRGLQTDVLRNEIEWFTEFPMGFKLNVPLTKRLGSFVLFVTDTFSDVIWQFPKFEHFLVRAIACSGALGFTTILASFIDVSRVLTAHITAGHRVFALLHHAQLSALTSLGYLFQGSKRNILRKRVDLCQYDRGQLILGTVIFTILFFLFPTFAAFYIFFTLLKIVTVLAQAAAWSVLIGIKEFPLLPLLLRALDPEVMTDGVSFTIEGNFRSLGASSSGLPVGSAQIYPTTMKRSVSGGTPDSASWLAQRTRGGFIFPDRRHSPTTLDPGSGASRYDLTPQCKPYGVQISCCPYRGHTSSLATLDTDLEPPSVKPFFATRGPSSRSALRLHRSISTPSATDLESIALVKNQLNVNADSPPNGAVHCLGPSSLGRKPYEEPAAGANIDHSPPVIDFSDGIINIESSGEDSTGASDPHGFASADDSDPGHHMPFLPSFRERRSDSQISDRDLDFHRLPRRRSLSKLRHFGFPTTAAHANHVTLLRMSATPCSYLALFRRYGLYWTYWMARSPAQTLLRGAVWGRPALDIQIIRAANNLGKLRSSWDKPRDDIQLSGWQMLEAWAGSVEATCALSPSTRWHRSLLLNLIVTVYSLSLLVTASAMLVFVRFCVTHTSIFP